MLDHLARCCFLFSLNTHDLPGLTSHVDVQMFLNVGGAVLGVAVLTVISNSVTANHGGEENPRAALNGYRAGYYAAIAMAALRVVLSLFFRLPCLYGEKRDGECVEEPGTSA